MAIAFICSDRREGPAKRRENEKRRHGGEPQANDEDELIKLLHSPEQGAHFKNRMEDRY